MKKEAKKRKSALDAATFSPYYVHDELKKVHWAKWKSRPAEPGIGKNLGDTVAFTAFLAVCSIGMSAIITLLTRIG